MSVVLLKHGHMVWDSLLCEMNPNRFTMAIPLFSASELLEGEKIAGRGGGEVSK